MHRKNVVTISAEKSHRLLGACLLSLALLCLLVARTTFAQDGQNWLQAVVNEQLTIRNLKGGSAFSATPSISGDFGSATGTEFSVFEVGGDVLRPSAPGYCSFVLLGNSDPLTVPASGDTVNRVVPGFCLELPDQARKPDESASYLPINYGGQSSEAIRNVLARARDGGLGVDFSTQLAIWQTNLGVTQDELASQLGQDLSQYDIYIDYLINGGEIPPAPEPPTVAESAESGETVSSSSDAADSTGETSDSSAPVSSSEDGGENATSSEVAATNSAEDDGTMFGVPGNLFWLIVAIIVGLLLLSIGLLAMALRAGNRNAALPRPTAPGTRGPVKAASPTIDANGGRRTVVAERPASAPAAKNGNGAMPAGTSAAPVASSSKPGQKCLICSSTEHATRECPEIQRPNQAFMPTEVELTLANVDDLIAPEDSKNEPTVPELDPFWNREETVIDQGVHFLQPPSAVNPSVDDEFFEVARMRSKLNNDVEVADTSPLMDTTASMETGPVARRHVTYVIREKGKADVIGSLGDDGGIISRISLKDQQILLPPKDVSTPHALLRLRPDGRVTIKDLRSKNGTWVDGVRVEAGKQVKLKDGDKLRLGDSAEFTIDLQRRKLVPVSGNSITRDLSTADQWLITRRNLHSVVIPNSHLSSPHMLIRPSDDVVSEIRIKDLHSHNPTLVEGDVKLSSLEDGTFVEADEIAFNVGKINYTITARSLKSVDVIGDRYKVIKQVYISKMADVYAVRDKEAGDGSPLLAAKILNVHQEKGEAARKAFEKEIAMMKAMSNPHLVPVVDVGHDEAYDAPFYVMPFLEGSDMRRVLHWRRRNSDQGALRLADIEKILKATCSALEEVHAQDNAHCDIKPANIFITHGRDIRLLDLGVVTPFGQHAEFFTQFYSAPEVGSKQLPPVSPASDVYSLGVVLLEMLTGIEAREMSGSATDQEASNTESSRPTGHSFENLENWLKNISGGLDFLELLHKATQRDSAERQQSVQEFYAEFETALASERAQAQLAAEGEKPNLAALSRQTDGV